MNNYYSSFRTVCKRGITCTGIILKIKAIHVYIVTHKVRECTAYEREDLYDVNFIEQTVQ